MSTPLLRVRHDGADYVVSFDLYEHGVDAVAIPVGVGGSLVEAFDDARSTLARAFVEADDIVVELQRTDRARRAAAGVIQ